MTSLQQLFDSEASENEWNRDIDVDLPPGKFVFRMISHRWSDKGSLSIGLKAQKAITGVSGEFSSGRYKPANLTFTDNSKALFLRFMNDNGYSIAQAKVALPKLVGRLYVADVIHAPNPSGGNPYVNLRNVVTKDSWDAKVAASTGSSAATTTATASDIE